MKNSVKLTLAIAVSLVVVIGVAVWFTSTMNTSKKNNKSTEVATSNAEWSPLVQQSCITCHAQGEDGKIARISDLRKTPEGWQDSISRMQTMWGVDITDEQKSQIVQELSAKNGLAPEETDKVMYWLTESGSAIESVEGDVGPIKDTCISCHAGGRPLAQYRTEDEWGKLKDFHLGMNPSLIYQMRTVKWEEESEKALQYLADLQRFDSEEWKNWQQSGKEHDITGNWRIVGHQPGKGMYSGDAEIAANNDQFYEKRTLVNHEGVEEKLEGNVRLFTGYSLRSSLADSKERKIRGVLNVSTDGEEITGRWNEVNDKGIYADEHYYKADQTALLAVMPKAIAQNATQTVRIIGAKLPEKLQVKDFEITEGAIIDKVEKQLNDDVWLTITTKDTKPFTIALKEAKEKSINIITYDKVSYLKVTPEFAMARLNYLEHKQSVQFEAIAYSEGADGKEGTEDDIELGPVPVKWSLKESEDREGDDDIKYVGEIDEKTGLFTPAKGGLNEERQWQGNNGGNVSVVATYIDPATKKEINNETFMLVTMPDYMYIK